MGREQHKAVRTNGPRFITRWWISASEGQFIISVANLRNSCPINRICSSPGQGIKNVFALFLNSWRRSLFGDMVTMIQALTPKYYTGVRLDPGSHKIVVFSSLMRSNFWGVCSTSRTSATRSTKKKQWLASCHCSNNQFWNKWFSWYNLYLFSGS